MNGYEINPEPGNMRVGQEGKSDLAVKFDNEWIYFEITQQQPPQFDDHNIQLSEVCGRIEEELKKGKLIPNNKKIDTFIVKRKRVLSDGWPNRFLDQLKVPHLSFNIWKHFDGVRYIVLDRKPDEPIFVFGTDQTRFTKKKLKRTIKMEANQIPAGAKGVIIINSSWNFGSFPVYSKK